jgi:hypothetical protein
LFVDRFTDELVLLVLLDGRLLAHWTLQGTILRLRVRAGKPLRLILQVLLASMPLKTLTIMQSILYGIAALKPTIVVLASLFDSTLAFDANELYHGRSDRLFEELMEETCSSAGWIDSNHTGSHKVLQCVARPRLHGSSTREHLVVA